MNNEVEAYPGELRELRTICEAANTLRFKYAESTHTIKDWARLETALNAEEDQKGDDHPAKHTVFWPGQTVHVCQRHFDGLMKVNTAMGGAKLDYREEAGNQCQSCAHEAKKG